MRVKILGTRAKIKKSQPYHSNHSGVLIDDKILIDIGEKEFLKYAPDFIFFSHFHPDHAWFVESHEKLHVDVPVFAPEENQYVKKTIILTDQIEINGYRITPVPTLHSLKVKSIGLVVEHEGKRIFYSSDVAWIEKRYHHLLNNLDMVITEGSYIRKNGLIRKKDDQIYGHKGIPDLITLFGRFTNRIVIMHLGSWFMKNAKEGKEKIMALRPEGLELDVAHDGKEYAV